MMQINSFIILSIIQVLLSSCSDLRKVAKKNETKSEVESKHWVYCTELDRVSDKKKYDTYDDDLCLKKKLKIGKYELHLNSVILNRNADSDNKIGYNELIIRKNKKIVLKTKLEKEGYPFYFVTGFAKIRKGVYQKDLNKDGIIEFALVHYGTDRNRYTKAKIYSLLQNGKLKRYGMGTYNKDLGEHVLFGCPDCHTINLAACKSCY